MRPYEIKYRDAHPKWKGGLYRTKDSYLRISAGIMRGKYAHRAYAERVLGRPLAADEEVEHLCRTRDCWPPTDFHLCIMPRALHDNISAANGSAARQRKRKPAPQRPLFPSTPAA